MVRLKVADLAFDAVNADAFQFQYGAIKRSCLFRQEWLRITFQFQYGAIKSTLKNHLESLFTEFQFQYGAIKSLIDIDSNLYSFPISIPVWCD